MLMPDDPEVHEPEVEVECTCSGHWPTADKAHCDYDGRPWPCKTVVKCEEHDGWLGVWGKHVRCDVDEL